ncbi:hypothetical protein AQUCO_00100034v1 [Aquilegia coerulea]|uniref:DUF3511 domain-containing protein n=1 Tax=Aquilegia coerulea TaxID=218851 RepID=A0A2G5F8D3_AQUCA|nr:hypothetical protein AQUCO_00100034v1 [Aquilegia coerulea]
MDDFRSKSCGDGRMQIQSYYGGGGGGDNYNNNSRAPAYGTQDLRCYSANYASYASSMPQTQSNTTNNNNKQVKFKKDKSVGSSSSRIWNFNDPEMQRKKRVASYKVYSVEGKVKGTLRKNFRWIKERYTQVVYGWW